MNKYHFPIPLPKMTFDALVDMCFPCGEYVFAQETGTNIWGERGGDGKHFATAIMKAYNGTCYSQSGLDEIRNKYETFKSVCRSDIHSRLDRDYNNIITGIKTSRNFQS